MKKEVKNIEASVRALLQNRSREKARPFAEILQYYGMERFLYRLSSSKYADRFILKGALLFSVWQIPERRTTLDIDFLAFLDSQVPAIEAVIKDVCSVSYPDGIKFAPETVEGRKIKEDADYEGVRVKFSGFLGRSRVPMQIDVGFGDIVYPGTEVMDYPVILDFPGPRLKGYPQESVISEKFEAMVRLGLLNSRMKDFYDIWLMLRQFEFNGMDIAGAIKKTFDHRKTDIPRDRPLFDEEIYDRSSDRQTLWRAFLKKGDIKNAPDTLSGAAKEIEDFLAGPVLAINEGVDFKKTWRANRGWERS